MTEIQQHRWLTKDEAAKHLRVSVQTITAWTRKGYLHKHQVEEGGRVLYDVEEINEFVRSRCFTKTPGDEVAVA